MGYIKRQDAIDAIKSVTTGNWSSKRYAGEIEKIPPAEVLPFEDVASGVEEAIRHLEITRAARLMDYGSYLHLRDAIYAIKRKRRRG